MQTDTPSLGWNLNDVKGWYKTLLDAMIAEIESLGIPKREEVKIDKSVNVSVNQSQSQEQSQKQEQFLEQIIEAIKDELTGAQLKEIKSIVENVPDPEEKKRKIFQKIKDFGIDVCSGILTNIITNPMLLNGLG